MAEELLIGVNVEGQSSLDSVNKKLDQTGEYSEKAVSEIGKLRKELKESKSDMLKYAEGTEQYNKALLKASQLQGKLKETNDIVRASVRDLGSTVKMVGGAVSGLASGFQIAQGAMALFGIENENTLKVIQNITAAMSITQGIVQFANGFDDLQDLMAGFRAESMKTSGAISELSDVGKEASNSLGNVAKEGAVIGSNLAGTQNIVDQTTKSYEKMTMSLEDYMKANVPATGSIKEAEAALAQYQAKTAENEEQINKVTDGLKENSKAQDDLNKSTEKATSGIKKQLLTMGLWIIAIAAATYAITKLLEWLNKIPEETKIKVDLENETINKLKTDYVKLRQFAIDYTVATGKERISELEKYAKKEFGVEADRLKAIKVRTGAWKEAFAEYLKTAEDTYYNEALSKRKTDTEASLASAKLEKQIYGDIIKDEKTLIGRQSVKKLIDEGKTTIAFGSAQEYKNAVELEKKSLKELEALNKLTYRRVDSGVGKVDPGKPTKSTTPKNTLYLDNRQAVKPNLTELENFYKPIIDAEIKYTNEENVILNDAKKTRSKYYYDTVLSQIEFAIKRENARKLDLQNELNYQLEQKNLIQDSLNDFDDKKTAYDIEIANLNDYEKNKANYLNLITAAENEFKNLGDKATQADKKRIEEKIKNYNDEITSIDSNIEAKKKEISLLVEQLKLYDGYPDKIKQITEQIAGLNVQIADSTRTAAELERDAWAERLSNFKGYVDALGTLNSAFVQIGEDQMEIIDNKTNKEKNDLELSEKYRQADSESQQQMMYELELANYNQKKKIFETNKAFQISSAIITGISGELDAIGNFLKNGGFTNPLAIASLAAETIAITTGTIMTVKKIASTSLDKPIPPSAGSGGGGAGGGVNVALNPAKESLTSNDERLNTMTKSNLKDAPQQKVLVSDINDVQAKVKTREENSSF